MEVVIRFDGVEPPHGAIRVLIAPDGVNRQPEGSPEVAFVGWLGLIRALADVATPDRGPVRL